MHVFNSFPLVDFVMRVFSFYLFRSTHSVVKLSLLKVFFHQLSFVSNWIIVIFLVRIVLIVFIFKFRCSWVDQILFGSFVSLYQGQLIFHCVGFRTFLTGRFVNSMMWLNFAMFVTQLLLVGGHSSTGYFLTHIL